MIALPERCCCCFAEVPVCFTIGGRCEDCDSLASARYNVQGAVPYVDRIKGTPDKRRAGKLPAADSPTNEYMKAFYSKN